MEETTEQLSKFMKRYFDHNCLGKKLLNSKMKPLLF